MDRLGYSGGGALNPQGVYPSRLAYFGHFVRRVRGWGRSSKGIAPYTYSTLGLPTAPFAYCPTRGTVTASHRLSEPRPEELDSPASLRSIIGPLPVRLVSIIFWITRSKDSIRGVENRAARWVQRQPHNKRIKADCARPSRPLLKVGLFCGSQCKGRAGSLRPCPYGPRPPSVLAAYPRVIRTIKATRSD